MQIITSAQNPAVKNYCKLTKGCLFGGEAARIPLEGLHLVEEAVKNKIRVENIFVSPEMLAPGQLEKIQDIARGCSQLLVVSASLIRKMSGTKNPQGVLAVAERPQSPPLGELIDVPDFLAVMVDRLQDPGNLGTIIRTAAAAGAQAVFSTPNTVDWGNEKVLRSTAGAIFAVPVIAIAEPIALIRRLQRKKTMIVVATTTASEDYYQINYCHPMILIIGNENSGVSPELIELASHKVRIPMSHKVESLNASVATGIILYEACRQRVSKEQGI